MTPFWKLHGIGNDFVFLSPGATPTTDFIRQICSRTDGVGSDGLIVVNPSGANEAQMQMWNPDGSESGMCGNGLRCAALWLNREVSHHHSWKIALGGGHYEVVQRDFSRFAVEMGRASVSGQPKSYWVGERELLGFSVDVGNPHLVFFVEEDPTPLLPHGKILEHHPDFPNRTNVHFARITRDEIVMATWERGAGPTRACGSGACAVASAATVTQGTNSSLLVHLPGGDLLIEDADDTITMIGEASLVYFGNWPSATGR